MGVVYGFSSSSSSSSLVCPEETNSVLTSVDDQDRGGTGDVAVGETEIHQNGVFLLSMGIPPLQSEECLDVLVLKESNHMPKDDYAMRLRNGDLDSSVRNEAIDWIWKVYAHYRFGPLTAYLSVNYLDRFLSYYQLPRGKEWMTQLLSTACFTLAAKMEETQVPNPLELPLELLEFESNYEFDARTIQRMELLVLSTLNWRMLAVTPFSFIDYLLQKINGGKSPPRFSMFKSAQLILNTTRRIEFLTFTPSEIASAVALYVLRVEAENLDSPDVPCFGLHINRERVVRCFGMIGNMAALMNVGSMPQSPISVLDAAAAAGFSYKGNETAPVEEDSGRPNADTNHRQKSPDAKKRKINRFA